MKVLYFGFSWAKDQKLDSYQQSIVDALSKAGHEVHCLRGNHLLKFGLSLKTFRGDIGKLAKYIKQNRIDLVLCKNNSGNVKALRDAVDCPFVIWSSDEVSHLFKPNASAENELHDFIDERCQLFVTTSACEKLYKKAFPKLAERIHFVPHCTSPDLYQGKAPTKEFEVSFVGASLDLSLVYRAVLKYSVKRDEKSYTKLVAAIDALEKDYYHDFKSTVARLNLEPILQELNLTVDQFKMHVSNMISNNERFQALDALKEFNTVIFGNPEWVDSLSFTTAIVRQFKPWRKIRSFEQLCEVYQSSKISISIPQHQVGSAIQYRVLDIMASDSLLITKHFEDSDLKSIFGDGCPVPTYRSVQELRDLSRYYLDHEDERLALVRRCQALITERFTFSYRLREMFKAAGKDFDQRSLGDGAVIDLKPKQFLRPFAWLTGILIDRDRRAVRKTVAIATAAVIAFGILLNLIEFIAHWSVFAPNGLTPTSLTSLISIVDVVIGVCLFGAIRAGFGGRVRAALLTGLAIWLFTRVCVLLLAL